MDLILFIFISDKHYCRLETKDFVLLYPNHMFFFYRNILKKLKMKWYVSFINQ